MFKKVAITTTLSATLLFGGALTSVSASASLDSPQSHGSVSDANKVLNDGNKQINRTGLHNLLDHVSQQNNGDNSKPETQKPNNQNHGDDATDQQANENQSSEDDQAKENQSDDQSSKDADGSLDEFEQEVVSLTNDEREENGLEPLEADDELSDMARDKSEDMNSNDYFDHNSPTYGSPFDMMDDYDIDRSTAGENIAHGQKSAEEVVDGWMNSEGHRENILNPDFTHIGVGYEENGNYWTQEFTG